MIETNANPSSHSAIPSLFSLMWFRVRHHSLKAIDFTFIGYFMKGTWFGFVNCSGQTVTPLGDWRSFRQTQKCALTSSVSCNVCAHKGIKHAQDVQKQRANQFLCIIWIINDDWLVFACYNVICAFGLRDQAIYIVPSSGNPYGQDMQEI